MWPYCWSPVHILLSPVQFRLLKDNELSVAVNVYSSRHHPFKTKSAISLITLPSKTKSVLSIVCQYAVICICSYFMVERHFTTAIVCVFRLSSYWYDKTKIIKCVVCKIWHDLLAKAQCTSHIYVCASEPLMWNKTYFIHTYRKSLAHRQSKSCTAVIRRQYSLSISYLQLSPMVTVTLAPFHCCFIQQFWWKVFQSKL